MTLFKISCDTCQTSLNVRQKSAIGQILACPKCGSMVQIKPPEDWEDSTPAPSENPRTPKPFVKPVPDPTLPETLSTISGSVSEGLQKQPGPTTVPEQKWHGDQNPKPPPSPPGEPTIREPVLPGDQWNSQRGQQRKKLLFAFSTTLAILVFGIAAIIFAVMQLAGDKEKENVAEGNAAANTTNAQSEKPGDAQSEKPPGQAQPKTSKTDTQNKKVDPADPGKKESGKTGSPTKGNEPMEKKKNPAESGKPTGDATDQGNPKKNTDAPPGFDGKEEPVDDSVLPDFFRELDEFSVIFEQDEPLLKLRQAFQEDDLPGEFGLSRFYVSKSLKKTPDPKLAMNVPIGEISFTQTTLLEFLDFHFQLTGVPVAVDVTSILLAGIQLDRPFDIVVTEKTTRQVLEEVAKNLGLVLTNGTHSLVLTIPDRDKPVERDYLVEDIAPSALQRQQLIDQIQVFINRKSWSSSGGPGIVTANDQKQSIVVKHAGWAQARVEEFLRHVRIRKGLAPKKENHNFEAGQHRLLLSKSGKNRKVTLLQSDPISLSKLFALLAKQNDLHVFVNWEATGESLLPSGNLPLAIEDETFEQFIGELAGGVKLKLVWHCDNVVELTSETGAASNLTFESYNIEEAISGSFTADKLLVALKNLLANNQLADFTKSEIGVDLNSGKALYAVLPQPAHRNVLKILNTAILNTAKSVDKE